MQRKATEKMGRENKTRSLAVTKRPCDSAWDSFGQIQLEDNILRTATKLLATNRKDNSLFECRLVRVELLRDDVVNERQSSADVLSCPVTEVLVEQALISSCDTHRTSCIQH